MQIVMQIDVWSDIACPWCYVGKRKLEAALAQFDGEVEVVWHAFELDPSMPKRVDLSSVDYAGRLAKKYRVPRPQAETMISNMTQTAAAEGLEFRFDRIRPGNTFDAHRLLHLAKTKTNSLQGALKERLLHAYMNEGECMGDHAALSRLAVEVGLEADEVQSVLSSDAFAAEVRQDEADAAAMGIRGVPFFVMDRRYAVPGAQPVETLLAMLDRAWKERDPQIVRSASEPVAEGAICGPEGCA